jgi:hypothetical protein
MATATANRRKGLTEPTKDTAPEYWLLAGHYDPDFVDAVGADLDELSRLQPNWDGYGAPVIDPAVIAAARSFVGRLPENLVYRPRVVPTSGGGLQLEWHHGSKILELEFESPRAIHFLQWHPDAGVEEEATFPVTDTERAVDLIQWFMSGTCV